MAFQSLLVPTDFSPESHVALEFALAWAERWHSEVNLVHVVEYLPAFAHHELSDFDDDKVVYQERMLNRAQERIHNEITSVSTEVEIHGRVRGGYPPHEILEAATKLKTDLIAIATHGRTGFRHALLGSVAEKVVRSCPCPVLSIRPPAPGGGARPARPQIERILYPTDLSPRSLEGLNIALELSRSFGARLHFLHVIDEPPNYPLISWEHYPTVTPDEFYRRRQEQAGESLRQMVREPVAAAGVEVEVHLQRGRPYQEIVELGRENFDLVVMSTHGRTGIKHALLGSVTERVLRLADCPVLTVRPEER